MGVLVQVLALGVVVVIALFGVITWILCEPDSDEWDEG